MTRRRLSAREWVLVALEVVLAVGALAGAVGMQVLGDEFSGEGFEGLPFDTMVVPSIALALINGVFPLVVAVGAVRGARWAPIGHLAVGAGLLGWMVAQLWFIGGGNWLQAVYLALAVVLLGLAAPAFTLRDRSHP